MKCVTEMELAGAGGVDEIGQRNVLVQVCIEEIPHPLQPMRRKSDRSTMFTISSRCVVLREPRQKAFKQGVEQQCPRLTRRIDGLEEFAEQQLQLPIA